MACYARWIALVWIFLTIASVVAASSTEPSVAAERIIDLVNEFRAKEGRDKLVRDPKLDEAAKSFATFMARTDKYGHAADGGQPAERVKRHGYDPCIVAENIAYLYNSAGLGTQELAQGFTQGWIDSSGHRKNMLGADVTETAVAIAQNRKSGYYYAVQLFARPKSAAIRFEVANRSTALLEYRLNERAFSLPPRHTRRHQECQRPSLALQRPAKESVRPQDGERYVIVPDESGKLTLRRE